MAFKSTASPTQQQQVQTILDTLEAQLAADGMQDAAGAIRPVLQNLETTSNLSELLLEWPAVLTAIAAAGPKLGQQAINQAAAAFLAIVNVYVPPAA